MSKKHRVVIIGGGFGGLYAARALRSAPASITLIDKRNFHLFQPLLYQVATGALSPANIAAPLRAILKRQGNVTTVLGEVIDLDAAAREVILRDRRVPYDTLIVAAGVRYNYFGHDDWAALAPSLKTIEDATTMRRRLLMAFEEAETCMLDADEAARHRVREYLTFVVIGGGPTGVELAGALGEIAHHTLQHNFRHIDPSTATIILIEGTDRLLPPYAPPLAARAAADLQRLGVTVRTHTTVTEIRPDAVVVQSGEVSDTIRTRTVVWAAGVQAVPLAARVAAATGAPVDRAGRLIVQSDCTLPGHPEISVIGDLAHFAHQDGKPLPGVGQVAIQQGKFVAQRLQARLSGQTTASAFVYHDFGSMATIGRAAAVAEIQGWHLTGWPGWLVWLFVHVIHLVQFENQQLVLLQWAWSYATRNRAARLITGMERDTTP